jgi:hypothetical protein
MLTEENHFEVSIRLSMLFSRQSESNRKKSIPESDSSESIVIENLDNGP